MADMLRCRQCDFMAETYTRLAHHVQQDHATEEETLAEYIPRAHSASFFAENQNLSIQSDDQETENVSVDVERCSGDEREEKGEIQEKPEEQEEDTMISTTTETPVDNTEDQIEPVDEDMPEDVDESKIASDEEKNEDFETNSEIAVEHYTAVKVEPSSFPKVLILPKTAIVTVKKEPEDNSASSDHEPDDKPASSLIIDDKELSDRILEGNVIKIGQNFVCYICHQRFNKKDRLAAHISFVHHGKKLYQCNVCGESFTWRESYRRHINLNHEANTIKCHLCGFSCSLRAEMRAHVNKDHRCHRCNKVFPTKDELQEHISTIHLQNKLNSKVSPSKSRPLSKTAKFRLRLKNSTCEICNTTFANRKYYNKHNRVVHGIYIRPPVPVQDNSAGGTATTSSPVKTESVSPDTATSSPVTTKRHAEPENVSPSTSSPSKSKRRAEPPFICSICKKVYSSNKSLLFHRRKIHNIFIMKRKQLPVKKQPPVNNSVAFAAQCNVCRLKFKHSCNLSRHMKVQHGVTSSRSPHATTEASKAKQEADDKQPPFICSICDRSFGRRGDLTQHERKSHPGEKTKSFQCVECNRRFSKKHHLLCHQRWHKKSRNKPHRCKMCDRGFYKKVDLIRHLQIHKNEKALKCDKCKHSFPSVHALVLHKKTHRSTGKGTTNQSRGKGTEYMCTTCGEEVTGKVALMYHVKSHPNALLCDICPYATVEHKKWEHHYSKHFDNKTKMFSCYYRGCSYKCKTKEGVKTHVSSHFKGECYKCEMCGFKTRYKPNLRRHMESVHPEKLEKEEKVQKKASQEPPQFVRGRSSIKALVMLRDHLKSASMSTTPAASKVTDNVEVGKDDDNDDTDEVKVTKRCRVCHKEFKYSSELRRHEWIHTDDKPFVCVNCGRGFTRQDTLRSHKCTPVGEKGFKCMHCDEHFDTRFQLSIHQVAHRQDVRVKCPLCDESFRSRVDLASHQYTIHNVESRLRSDLLDFSCGQCNKSFKLWKNMKIHINKPGPCQGVPPIPNTATAYQQMSPTYKSSTNPFKTPGTPVKNDGTAPHENFDQTPPPVGFNGSESPSSSNRDSFGLVISNVCSLTDSERRATASHPSRLQSLLSTRQGYEEHVSRPGYDASSNGTDEGYSEKSSTDSKPVTDASSPASLSASRPKDRFKCKHCEIVFPDVMLFTIHMGIHGPGNAFQCSNCGENCGNRNAFMLHFIGQHS